MLSNPMETIKKLVCDHELSGTARDPKCDQETQVNSIENEGDEDNDVLMLCHREKGKKNPLNRGSVQRLNRGSVQAQVSKFKIPILFLSYSRSHEDHYYLYHPG